MQEITKNKSFTKIFSSSAETYKLTVSIWNLLLISFVFDFGLIFYSINLPAQSSFDSGIVTAMLLLALLLTFVDFNLQALKGLRSLTDKVRDKKHGNLQKVLLVMFAVIIVGELLFRFRKLILQHFLIPLALLVFISYEFYKLYKDTAARNTKLEKDQDFQDQTVNQWNLLCSIAPAFFCRAAALILVSQGISESPLYTTQYLLALLIFASSYPHTRQFFQSCCRCGQNVIRVHVEQPKCRDCKK